MLKPSTALDDTPPAYGTVTVALSGPRCAQAAPCARLADEVRGKLAGRYLGWPGTPPEIVAAHLDLRGLSYDDYVRQARHKYKGNSVRDALKAQRLGFYAKLFPYALHVPDVYDINHSLDVRCGRPMSEAYRRGVEELGGWPQGHMAWAEPECPLHYDIWWGCFTREPGHRQGEVVTDERLVGYIRLRRIGNVCHYGQILGHGDFLRHGIMFLLHFEIMRWILDPRLPCAQGIEHLFYAGYFQGTSGLRFWKTKLLMAPRQLMVASDPRSCPDPFGGAGW